MAFKDTNIYVFFFSEDCNGLTENVEDVKSQEIARDEEDV